MADGAHSFSTTIKTILLRRREGEENILISDSIPFLVLPSPGFFPFFAFFAPPR
jgi:hypothetical protein